LDDEEDRIEGGLGLGTEGEAMVDSANCVSRSWFRLEGDCGWERGVKPGRFSKLLERRSRSERETESVRVFTFMAFLSALLGALSGLVVLDDRDSTGVETGVDNAGDHDAAVVGNEDIVDGAWGF